MTNSKYNVLITRPEKSGRVLQECLKKHNILAFCQPFFDYHTNADITQLHQLHHQLKQPILIFISVAAVEFAQQIMPISTWATQCIIAVGNATKVALAALDINAITPSQHDSDGLLELSQLNSVNNQDVIIIRGDGGRELLAEELTSRGAHVHYFESYQRIWRDYSQNLVDTWRENQINCIVVTSDALLQSVACLIDNSENYWKEQCLWVVASARIADNAHKLGIRNVLNAHGASDKAIITALANN